MHMFKYYDTFRHEQIHFAPFLKESDKSNLNLSPSKKHGNYLISILSSDDEGAARGPTRNSFTFLDYLLFLKTKNNLL